MGREAEAAVAEATLEAPSQPGVLTELDYLRMIHDDLERLNHSIERLERRFPKPLFGRG